MHLKSLRIENFRLLQHLEVEKLGRVNLIVGRNNCGKSTVLEALRIYAGNAHPALLEEISLTHNEKFRISDSPLESEGFELPFEHFFTGRRFPEVDDEVIYVGEINDQSHPVKIEHVYCVQESEEYTSPTGEVRLRARLIPLPKAPDISYDKNALNITANGKSRLFNIDQKGSTQADIFRRRQLLDTQNILPCSFIPTQFTSMDELADIWDTILFSEYSDTIKTGLQIIDGNFEDLAFVKSEGSRQSFMRIAKIKLKNEKRAYPLNSMGDGMLRVLQLILKAFPAQNGFLLIDELENGLHYTVQEKVWNLLFELAEKFNIQVFAATHSWDCIESFAKVANSKGEDEGVLIHLGKSIRTSDKGQIIANVFDSEKLAMLTQADIEVR